MEFSLKESETRSKEVIKEQKETKRTVGNCVEDLESEGATRKSSQHFLVQANISPEGLGTASRNKMTTVGKYVEKAKVLNRNQNGDQACFLLFKDKG